MQNDGCLLYKKYIVTVLEAIQDLSAREEADL